MASANVNLYIFANISITVHFTTNLHINNIACHQISNRKVFDVLPIKIDSLAENLKNKIFLNFDESNF